MRKGYIMNTITIQKELDFYDLLEECWSGTISTLETIESNNKEEEFMDLLSEMNMSTLTEINDFLRFDETYIYDCLSIDTEDDEEEA